MNRAQDTGPKKAARPMTVELDEARSLVHVHVAVEDKELLRVLSRMSAEERVAFVSQVLRFGAIIAQNEGQVERLTELEGHAVILQVKPKNPCPQHLYS